MKNPLEKTKEEYSGILDAIGSDTSPVGIDAAYTHAVIIEYLQRIDRRLSALEQK